MKPPAIERLAEINRRFYSEHGRDFSDTRHSLQPGVRRLIESLNGDETILDLGCGNGGLAAELSRRGHRGFYLGLDLSASLLEQARAGSYAFEAQFLQVDVLEITAAGGGKGIPFPLPQPTGAHDNPADSAARTWSVIAAFAMLHHIPGREHRLRVLSEAHEVLRPDGRFFLSVWQFLESPRFKSRIQPWSTFDLLPEDLDPGDFLLDWRHGLPGLRYVHQFDKAELTELAAASGFTVAETFYSDGKDRRSGLYQVWRRA